MNKFSLKRGNEIEKEVNKLKEMSLVDFVTDILGIELLSYQKDFLNIYEKNSQNCEGMFARGQQNSRYIYAMLYKALWNKYCNTDNFELNTCKNDNEEIFKKEYECIWNKE